MKFGRDTESGGFGGCAGGEKFATYGSDGSQRTP